MSRETIARTLKRLREQRGLTADQVGTLVGKSGKTVNAWENNRGQPDAEILMQLCDIYNVSDILAEFRDNGSETPFVLFEHEKSVIMAYRNQPDMQAAVDRLLGVPSQEQKIHTIYRAANSEQNSEPTIEQRDEAAMRRLANAPRVKREEDL